MNKIMHMGEEYAGYEEVAQMTMVEAETGTSETGRLISPKVLHDYVGEATQNIILETYSDGLGYTVNGNSFRTITFSNPTKSGYTLKNVSAITNQNYMTLGVGLTSTGVYVNLYNHYSSNLDAIITLQYIWERNS